MKGKQNGPIIKDSTLIAFRMSEEEIQKQKEKAYELGYSMARYMRHAVTQDYQKDIETIRVVNMATLELKNIGNELNSLTYAGNTGSYRQDEINEKINVLAEAINKIQKDLKEISYE